MNIFQMSLTASVLIVAVVIIRALTLHKLPKKTLLVLWGVVICRLLMPFSISSRFSFYTGLDMVKRMFIARTVTSSPAGMTVIPNTANIPGMGELTEIGTSAVSISSFEIVWLIGMCACALFFIVAYIKCRREFKMSLPIESDFAARWLRKHPLRRFVQIRQSDRIKAPLTYGVFHPVILLPKETDWTDEIKLRYILIHEFTHIRRYDTLAKLVLTAAVGVHWFNPFVWVMYALANRDIELSCDETVVRTFGETIKSAYALTLIGLEEKKSRFTPLVNNFSKNAIEERIVLIMKIRKTSIAGIVLALALIVGTTTVFATNAIAAGNDKNAMAGAYSSGTPMSAQDQEKLNQQNRESIAKKYAIYEKYGLTYDQKTDSFYYDGKLVRYFSDKLNSSGTYNSFTRSNGVIDLKAVRNANYELTGIAPVSQEEYDKSTQSIKRAQNASTTGAAQENGSANNIGGSTSAVEAGGKDNTLNGPATAFSEGDPNYVDNSLNAYLDYGVSYDKVNKQWTFDDKPIHYLSDGDNATYMDNSENATKYGVSLEVIRKADGQIEKLAEISK